MRKIVPKAAPKMSKILDNLYLSSHGAAKSEAILIANKIRSIVICAPELAPKFPTVNLKLKLEIYILST